jgi:heat shock protein HslJ
MNKIIPFMFFVGFIWFTGCKSSKQVASLQVPAIDMKSVAGDYLGMLPCADCEKIRFRLSLNEDRTFISSMIYIGKSDIPIEYHGKYEVRKDGIIVLIKKDKGMKYFKPSPKGLLMLDIHGNEIKGSMSDSYILTLMLRKDNATEAVAFADHRVAFNAHGNYPSCSLEMDSQNAFLFRTPGLPDVISPPADINKAQDADVTRYRAVSDNSEIIVTVYSQECMDTISGEKYAFKVKVEIKSTSKTDARVYEGCGDFIADTRLDHVWTFEKVNGISLNPADYSKGLPTLEILTKENRISGQDGCNTIGGAMTCRGNSIRFISMYSTRMACPKESLNVGLLLGNKTFDFVIENHHLILKQGETEVAVLIKSD